MDLNIIDFAVRGSTLGTILILTVLIWRSRIARAAQFAWTLLAVASTAKSWSHLVESAGASADIVWVLKIIGTLGALGLRSRSFLMKSDIDGFGSGQLR